MESLWFNMRSIDKVRSGAWRHPLGYLDSHILLLPVGGELRITAAGRTLQLSPAEAFLGLPGQLLHVPPAERDDELFVIRFDALEQSGDSFHQAKQIPLAGVIALPRNGEAIELCRRAELIWQERESAGRLKTQAVFYELLSCLQENADRAESPEDAALNRTRAYMERHSDRNVTIAELAELAGLSRYYYMRLFKAHYGISAMDYLTELRMNKAKLLMEQSKPKLREIARQVGYGDEFYFIRKFKQQVGIPPATYIRNRRRRIAAYSFPNIGQLLALQIVPFAAPMDHAWTDGYRRKYRADVVTTLSHDYEFNLAALRSAKPDSIIGVDAFLPPEEQIRIREVAPSLFVPWRENDWRSHLQLLAEFLDMPGEAKAWLDRYDRLAEQTRERVYPLVGREKVLVVYYNKEAFHVYGRQTVAGVLYDDLGLDAPDQVRGIRIRETVTVDRLAQIDADRILLMVPGGARAERELMAQSAEWQRCAAALEGRVTSIAAWPWFDYSAYAQRLFLLTVPRIFEAAYKASDQG